MATVVPINNNADGDLQQAPYNYSYSYPPNYTTAVDSSEDKPPSYEQTIQHLSETNNTSENSDAAVVPITTITSSSTVQLDQLPQNQT
jgi:hypothetical protein